MVTEERKTKEQNYLTQSKENKAKISKRHTPV